MRILKITPELQAERFFQSLLGCAGCPSVMGSAYGFFVFVKSGQGYAVIGGITKPGFRPHYRDESFFVLPRKRR